MNEPVVVALSDTDKLIGKFAVLFRNDQKVPAEIVGVDTTEKRIIYELMGGVDKGKKRSGRFDPKQTANVYEWENLNLALLDT